MADSFWLEEAVEPRSQVRHDGRPDAIVVGGGVTGLSCALALAEGGLRAQVREARTVASGASGRNGGFALRGGAMPYDQARERFGVERARAYWALTEDALDRMEPLAGDALRRVGSLRLAADKAERNELEAEYRALREDGLEAEWLDELEPPLAGRYHGAILHPVDGALQPARWVRRLAARAAEAGVEIREHARVESLEELDAPVVVLATDGYTRGLLPELDAAVSPTRGQVLVTEPLQRLDYPRPHYARHGYDYWQQTPDRRLVLGGRRDTSLETEFTGEEGTTRTVQAALDAFAVELVGLAPTIEQRWSGIWGTTADDLPLVGAVPGRPGLWVACGYSGHGNVLGFASGALVARAVLGGRDPLLDLFDPGRALQLEAGRVG
jgi:glycine/D-amino acid oxidase-like deaminating enzyme